MPAIAKKNNDMSKQRLWTVYGWASRAKDYRWNDEVIIYSLLMGSIMVSLSGDKFNLSTKLIWPPLTKKTLSLALLLTRLSFSLNAQSDLKLPTKQLEY